MGGGGGAFFVFKAHKILTMTMSIYSWYVIFFSSILHLDHVLFSLLVSSTLLSGTVTPRWKQKRR